MRCSIRACPCRKFIPAIVRPFPNTSNSASPPAPVMLALSPEEVRIVRTALHVLLGTYTRHEHMYGAIHAILERLPAMSEAAPREAPS